MHESLTYGRFKWIGYASGMKLKSGQSALIYGAHVGGIVHRKFSRAMLVAVHEAFKISDLTLEFKNT